MQGERIVRLARQMRREVNEIIRRELNIAPDIILTVTDVTLSKDYKNCRVYYSVFTDKPEKQPRAKRIMAGLFRSKKKLFKFIIGKNMKIKNVPDVSFELDRTPVRAAEVEKILNDISEKKI